MLVSPIVHARIAGTSSKAKMRSGAKLVGSAWPGGADIVLTLAMLGCSSAHAARTSSQQRCVGAVWPKAGAVNPEGEEDSTGVVDAALVTVSVHAAVSIKVSSQWPCVALLGASAPRFGAQIVMHLQFWHSTNVLSAASASDVATGGGPHCAE